MFKENPGDVAPDSYEANSARYLGLSSAQDSSLKSTLLLGKYAWKNYLDLHYVLHSEMLAACDLI